MQPTGSVACSASGANLSPMDPTIQALHRAAGALPAVEPASEKSFDLGAEQYWPDGPLAAIGEQPGSGPYNSTGRFARPILNK